MDLKLVVGNAGPRLSLATCPPLLYGDSRRARWSACNAPQGGTGRTGGGQAPVLFQLHFIKPFFLITGIEACRLDF
jgi:hypothetical protein